MFYSPDPDSKTVLSICGDLCSQIAAKPNHQQSMADAAAKLRKDMYVSRQ